MTRTAHCCCGALRVEVSADPDAVVACHCGEDANAQLDAAVRRDVGVPFRHRPLHLDRAAYSIDDARELHQQAVAGGLDDAAVVFGDFRINELGAERFEALERAFLVGTH